MLGRIVAACLFAALVAGCGGGGGGGDSTSGPGAAAITMTVTPPGTVSATTAGTAPAIATQVTTSSTPPGGLYIAVAYTTHGIASLSLSDVGDAEQIDIAFQSPSALGAGVYTDTLDVKVCYDQQCTRQVSNSPQQVTVTYNVVLDNPAISTPTLTALSPSSAQVGSAGFTIVASGSEFAPTSVLYWNGQPRATTYVSATSLSAQINASDLAFVGSANVVVSNESSGGGASLPMVFAINAPAPSISAVSPSTVGVGGAAFVLTVTGSGFDPSAQAYWNGSLRTTNYVSPTQLTVQIDAADIGSTGTFPITVKNLDGTAVSNATPVSVINAPLSLTQAMPASVTAGGPAFVDTVIGTGFSSSSVVRWNGSPRTTTFVSTTELLAQITASDIAAPGSASVTVVDGGTTTPAKTVTIAAASIDAVAFQINPQHNGAINFANVVAPSDFPLSSTWTTTLDGPPSYALIAGGRVFVTVSLSGGGSELVALNAANGARLWGPIALPYAANASYDNGKVFVLSADIGSPGMLSAYDAASGTQLWNTALTSQYWFTSPPTAANGFVYVGGSGGGSTIFAVDQSNGAQTWTAQLFSGTNSSPAVTADGLYVSYPCETYDLRPATGERVWYNNTGCSGGGGQTPTVANGIVYSPNAATGFGGMAFDAQSGALLTSYAAAAPPVIGPQMGYFLQAGTLRGITLASGVIQWSFAGDGQLTTAPILVNGYIFVFSDSGNLYGLDAATGNLLWSTNLGGPMPTGQDGYALMQASGLAAGDGLLVVPAGNRLTAFTLSSNP